MTSTFSGRRAPGGIVALSFFVAAVPATAQSMGEKSGANAVMSVAPTTADFVLQAAQSDMFEMQSSKLALEKGDAMVKTFSTHMIEAHEKTSEQLKTALASEKDKIRVPTDVSSAQKSMLDDLGGRSGGDLADQYVDDQVSAHKDAVSLFKRYAEGGDNPKLKAWAAKTLPDLRQHLEMAQALDK